MADSGWDSQGPGQQGYGYQQPSQPPGYEQQPAYPQPAYPQPGYPQPGYGPQPGYLDPYQQPGYPQPGYPAPGAVLPYQQPGYPPVQPGYQQVAQPSLYLDPVTGLTIPVGTEVASVGIRVGAFFLSLLFWLLAALTLEIAYIIWGAITWSNGQTPTQSLLGLRCWKLQEQQTATWGVMLLRGLGQWVIDSIAFGGLVSFIMMLVNKDRRTLYDHLSGVVVLRDPNKVLAARR